MMYVSLQKIWANCSLHLRLLGRVVEIYRIQIITFAQLYMQKLNIPITDISFYFSVVKFDLWCKSYSAR